MIHYFLFLLIFLGIFLLALSKPVHILTLVIFILPLKTLYAKGNLVYAPKILMMLSVLGLLAKITSRKKGLLLTHLEVPIVIIILMMIVRVPTSDNPYLEIGTVWYLLAFWGLVFAMVNLLTTEKAYKVVLISFAISAFIPSIAAYYQFLTGNSFLGGYPIFYHGGYRATGTFTKVTGLSQFLQGYFAFFISYYFLSSQPLFKSKNLDLIVLLFNSFPLLIAVERSGVGGAILSLLFLGYKMRRNKSKLIIPILLTIGIVIFVISNPIWRYRLVGESTYTPVSYQSRFEELKVLWNIIYTHPLTGIGVGNYRAFQENWAAEKYLASVPHNIMLLFALAGGVWGIILFVWVIYIIVKGYKRAMEKVDNGNRILYFKSAMESSAIALFGYSVTLITHNALGSDVLWILTGLLVSSVNKVLSIKINEERKTH